MSAQSPERRCAKPGCGEPAAASLAFRYTTGEVWLGDLGEPDPARYDLCAHHAEQLTVPRGWERVDERTEPVGPLPSPPSHDGARSAGTARHRGASPPAGADGAADRYAALSADLPRVAAEVGAREDDRGIWAVSPSRELLPTPPGSDEAGGAVADFDRGSERRERHEGRGDDGGQSGEPPSDAVG